MAVRGGSYIAGKGNRILTKEALRVTSRSCNPERNTEGGGENFDGSVGVSVGRDEGVGALEKLLGRKCHFNAIKKRPQKAGNCKGVVGSPIINTLEESGPFATGRGKNLVDPTLSV